MHEVYPNWIHFLFMHTIHNIFIKYILNIFNKWFRYYCYELGCYDILIGITLKYLSITHSATK